MCKQLSVNCRHVIQADNCKQTAEAHSPSTADGDVKLQVLRQHTYAGIACPYLTALATGHKS